MNAPQKGFAPSEKESLSGFTLVETMVAIAVLAIALVGPYSAVETALNASYVARDELIASSLAQEGMEYIRSIRDNNYLNNRVSWLTGLSTLGCYNNAASYCIVDPTLGDVNTTPSAISASPLGGVPVLKVTSTGLYNHQNLASNTNTRFKRTVQITTVSATEVKVTVIVSWISAHQSYSVTVTDNLQNWL